MRRRLRVEADAAFSAFVAANRSGLVHMAIALTGDRSSAEDLVQIALSRTYSRWPQLMDQQPLAYARRIIVNANHDRWRRRSIREQTTMGIPDGPGADALAVVTDRAAAVAALSELTDRERRVVVLRFLVDLTEAETAHELGIALGTVKSTTHRALAKLRASGHLYEEAVETP